MSTLSDLEPARKRAIVWVCIALILVLAAGLQYRLWQHGLYTKSADESSRIILARAWLDHPWPLQAEVWLPLHKIFLGLTLALYDDTFAAPWIGNGMLGLAIVIAVGWLSWTLFPQRETALLAMVLAACFGPRLIIAAVPLSESLYCLCLLCALAFLARWTRTPRGGALVGAVLFTMAGEGVRYEAWLFGLGLIGVAGLVLARNREHGRFYKNAVLLLVTAAVFAVPVAWMYFWQVQQGAALGFLSASGNRYFAIANPNHAFFNTFCDSTPVQFLSQNFVSMNLFGLAAAVGVGLRDRTVRAWMALPVLFFAAMSALSVAGYGLPSHNFWRIPVVWSLALIPFTAYWVVAQAQHFGGKAGPYWLLAGAIPAAMLLTAFLIQAEKLAATSEMDAYDVQAGQVVRAYLDTHKGETPLRAHIQGGGFHALHLTVASGKSKAFLSPWHPEGAVEAGTLKLEWLQKQGVRLLVLWAPDFPQVAAPPNTVRVLAHNPHWAVVEIATPPR